ncbi:MAG: diaminopimelate epimerase [Fusobacterium perfoetens]|uniref:diaminopimelate epimerase n=1 Tax=Fusobacterium perfoetens TaxID=852 RepID=UPI0023F29307|nr:diaminopimelate epimerase [Fusobacterium perfoetens]MCI6151827.1 diaminopimelate epimerase [Fusobacterium perfoetens]MDY3236812.1 diaminopimelate epimerase [Fusobacterium perfoetens]
MKFTKMQGAGNDFLLIDGFKYNLEEIIPKIKNLCDRRFGVGGDGIMVALPSETCDIKMFYYNSDGSQGEMCGNGLRCFVKFVYEKGIVQKENLKIETLAGVQYADLTVKDGKVEAIEIEIGNPIFNPKDIPVNVAGEEVFNREIEIFGEKIKFSTIFLGVPHTVIFMENENQYDINKIGREIEVHPLFPKKTNVNFIFVKDRKTIKIFTWERGAGRTLACGTGSCSAGLISYRLGYTEKEAKIITEGGDLYIKILENGVKLRGGAEITFEGEVDLKKY